MVTLEHIKLLETKISRAINFVAEVTEENSRLKKRNDELEAAVEKLREEKTRVEEGIVSALGKLNQFEDAIERSLSSVKTTPKPQKTEAPRKETANSAAEKSSAPARAAASTPAVPAQTPAASQVQAAPAQTAAPVTAPAQAASTLAQAVQAPHPSVPSAYTVDEELDDEVLEEINDSGEAELDIF